MCLYQQQLRLREIYIGEAHIQSGLNLIFLEFGNLISDELAVLHCFLGYSENRLRSQQTVVRLIHGQQHVGARGDYILLRRLRVQVRTLDEFMGASEIGHQLIHGHAVGVSLVDNRIVERSCRNAAVVLRVHCGDAAKSRRIISRARLRNLRLCRCRQVSCSLNLRMVLNRDLLCLLQVQSAEQIAQGRMHT